MGNIVQLKGKNFLGVQPFGKKVYPVTKAEAVFNEDGTNMKQTSEKVTSLDTELNDTTNGIANKVSAMQGYFGGVPEKFLNTFIIDEALIKDGLYKYYTCRDAIDNVTIQITQEAEPVLSFAPFMLQFTVENVIAISNKGEYQVNTILDLSSLSTGTYLLTIQYGIIKLELLKAIKD